MNRKRYNKIVALFLLCGLSFNSVYASNITITKCTTSKDSTQTPDELKQLYAQSACLLDADTGRVLFEKNGYQKKAMASTTKIMTCIVTLENANLDDVVTISKNAAKQPDVQLNVKEGEQYYLKDLLYSLMLESHNDAAVAIAEHVGGSIKGFAAMMNQKAKELGCDDTYFITPNGLDATDETGTHSTTATDLAKIMAYCIKKSPQKEAFLKITGTSNHSFSDLKNQRSFSCNNHNAFLSMMDGALSGKTGFTGDAGYCYVGALERDGRCFVVALLACGWPNNKGYKWSDTKKLMNYGLNNYSIYKLEAKKSFSPITVLDGQQSNIAIASDTKDLQLLLGKEESAKVEYDIPDTLMAPIQENEVIGTVKYYVNAELYKEDPIYTIGCVAKIDYKFCFKKIQNMWLLH